MPRLLPLLTLFFLGISLVAAPGQRTLGMFDLGEGKNKSSVEVVSVFSALPPHGYAPLRLRLRNGTDTDRTWVVRIGARNDFPYTGGDAFESTFRLAATRNSETVHDIVAPIPTLFESGRGYKSVNLEVRLSAPPFGEHSTRSSTSTPHDWPVIALSTAIKDKNLLTLNDTIDKKRSGTSEFGISFDPGDLPSDWRAYTGLDFLLISDDEWVSLAPGARTAIVDWMLLGGDLHIYSANDATTLDALGIPGATGLGGRDLFPWDGANLDAEATVSRYSSLMPGNRKSVVVGTHYSKWSLHNALGERSFGSWQVAVILVLFGVLVGPVNLFVLAKPGQRHRLFITTPIISLGTSLILVVLILFQDGTGGTGRRFAFLELRPDQRKAYLIQEQVARTGVIFRTSFDLEDAAFMSPVVLPRSPWASTTTDHNRPSLGYSASGATFGGDWFQSRKEQGHYLESVRPTRARLELVPPDNPPAGTDTPADAAPTVVSSIEFPLDSLHYRNPAGDFFRSPGPVATGEKTTLEPVGSEEFYKAIDGAASLASESLHTKIRKLCSTEGTFFAVARSATPMVATLPSIGWVDDRALVHGPVEPAP